MNHIERKNTKASHRVLTEQDWNLIECSCRLSYSMQMVLWLPYSNLGLIMLNIWQMSGHLNVSVDKGTVYYVCLITVTGLKDCSPSSNAVVTRQSAFYARCYDVIHIFWFVALSCMKFACVFNVCHLCGRSKYM